ncbi:glycosyltransferase family 4 protein [Priestia aryabhattai]|uniref:glycosyltransferase family 4 protein n=1 Tax=Priestia aryabhattai TaxID=412384 RepID=UPI003D2DF28B
MNVLLVGFNLDGAMGDNYYQLCNNMVVDKNYNWFGLSQKNKRLKIDEIDFKDVLILEYNKKNLFSIVHEIKKIKNFIKEKNIESVFFLTPNLVFNIAISLILKGKKMFYFLHDPIPHSGEKILRRLVINLQNKIVSHLSNTVVVASDTISSSIKRNNILGLRNKKIEVIELGLLDNLAFKQLTQEKSEEEIDILFFGRIEHYKGLDVLAQALRYSESLGNNYTCQIVGKGSLNEFIKDKDLSLFNINNEYVSDYELASFIKKSKIVVFPYKNATGTQTIQAVYYYGKPVIVTNVGCFSDYVVNGVTGFIVDNGNYKELANKIDFLIKDYDIRHKMGANAQSVTKARFSMNMIAKKYIKLLKIEN